MLAFDTPGAFLKAVEENSAVMTGVTRVKIKCENAHVFASLIKDNPEVRRAIFASKTILVPHYFSVASATASTRAPRTSFLDVLAAAVVAAAPKRETSEFFKLCFPSHDFVRKKFVIKRLAPGGATRLPEVVTENNHKDDDDN